MKKHLSFALRCLLAALFAIFVLAPPAHSAYQPTPTGTGFVTVANGLQVATAKSFPTGTGFYRATSGTLDGATTLISLSSSDVTGVAPVVKGGTGLSAIGGEGTVLRSNGSALSFAYTGEPSNDGLRLTLQAATPVPAADVASSSTVYLTPFRSNRLSIYDGGGWVLRTVSVDPLLTLSGLLSGTNYDVFAYWTGSAVALELGAAWTSATVRADVLTRIDGVLVKNTNQSRRYLGTIRTASATTTLDTAGFRFLYNEYNKVRRALRYQFTADWSFTGTTLRMANGSAAAHADVVLGSPAAVSARIEAAWYSSTVALGYAPQVGYDAVAQHADNVITQSQNAVANYQTISYATDDAILTSGYHAINWLEQGAASTLTVRFGQSVLRAWVDM